VLEPVEPREPEEPSEDEEGGVTRFAAEFGHGLGCLMAAIGVAVIIWALSGFPKFWA